MNYLRLPHYHIHWSGKTTLDYEPFATGAEAEESAKQLARPGETFTIEEHGETCPQCMALMKKSPSRDSSNEASM
jgi:hypothetical protein